MFRKWISLLVMVAFVVTAMPFAAHAYPSHDRNAKIAEIGQAANPSVHEGCHGHGARKDGLQRTADKKAPSGKSSCCDKTCECLGGFCNGSAKILGFANDAGMVLSAAMSLLVFEERHAVSDYAPRLKRPPRA